MKKKLYLCTLNCDYWKQTSLFHYEERYYYNLFALLNRRDDGAGGG